MFSVAVSSAPTSPVTVAFSGSDAGEISVRPQSIEFDADNWMLVRRVTVTGEDDAEADGNVKFSVGVTIVSDDLAFHGAEVPDLVGTNYDDEISAFDPNGDATITVSDIFYLINHLFAGGPGSIGSGDANGDGTVSISDIFYLINHLFAGGPAPS